MQTRRSSRHVTITREAVDLPDLPGPVQLKLLDILLLHHQHPSEKEYELWPFKSSLCWLMSLQRVCKAWHGHIGSSNVFVRRCRLERCKQLCLLHDYATIIGRRESGRSKAARLKAVPRWLQLPFEDGSCTRLSVPRGKQPAVDLPPNALVLATAADGLTEPAFTTLLHDLDFLDKGQAASPLVLKVVGEPSSMTQLAGRAAPLLQRDGPLADIVMESVAGCLFFIPTGRSFTRSMPHDAAAAVPPPQL